MAERGPRPALKWVKVVSGLYEAKAPEGVYQVEDVTLDVSSEEKRGHRRVWICRHNGKAFERADTLADAKQWCQNSTEGDWEEVDAKVGRPLVEVL